MSIAKDTNGNFLVLDGIVFEDGLFKGFKHGALVYTTSDLGESLELSKKHNVLSNTVFKTN